MTTTVTLDEQAAQALEKLRRQAAARGIPLDRFLTDLAGHDEPNGYPAAPRSPHDLTQAEFRKWLVDLSAGMPPVPSIPTDFSRADLYDDHD